MDATTKAQQVQPDTQVEGFWFITSLIVVIMIVMVVGIILFLVYVFTGDVFKTTCNPQGVSNRSLSNESMDLSINETKTIDLVKPTPKEEIERKDTVKSKQTRNLSLLNQRRAVSGLLPMAEFDIITNTLTEYEMKALMEPVSTTDLPDPIVMESLRTAALPLFEVPQGFTGLILANGKQFLKIHSATIHDQTISFEYTYIAAQKQSLVPKLRFKDKLLWQGSSFEMTKGCSVLKSFDLPKEQNYPPKAILELVHMPSEKVMASTSLVLSNNTNTLSNTSTPSTIEPPIET